MGTSLSTGTGATTPSVKLRNVGDHVDIAIFDLALDLPRKIYNRDQPMIGPNGKPKTQHKITGVIVGGTGVINEDDEDRPLEPGEVAAIYVAGRDKWDPDLDKGRAKGAAKSWSEALNDLDGGLQVGDVVRWKFEAEVPGKGNEPRKVRTYKLRHPKPDEGDLRDRCEELHRQETATTVPTGASGPVWDDEEPFLDLGDRDFDVRNLRL
jgi:hypothetical protein